MVVAGVRRSLGARPAAGTSGGFARVNVESAELVEEYRYRQGLSRNPWTNQRSAPVGRLRVVVPYDGGEHFTRDAVADLAVGGASDEALIGHLVLSGYTHTDLPADLGLDDTVGAIPLNVPVAGTVGEQDLTADRQAYVISHEYRPDPHHLPSVPISVSAELLDPDGVDLAKYDAAGETIKQVLESLPGIDQVSAEGRRLFEQLAGQTPVGPNGEYTLQSLIADLATQIQQRVSFRSSLQLRLTVRLHLPAEVEPSVRPVLERVAIEWPSITSLRTVHLEIRGTRDRRPRVIYNPNTRCVEWFEVPMAALEKEPQGGIRTYSSPPMVLTIEQPGELYEEPDLRGSVTARIDGALLSGVQTRLFNATGGLVDDGVTRLCSIVEDDFELVLGDAFAGRTLTPFQHLHFDQVKPDEARVADVVTALESRGFDVWKLSLAGNAAQTGSGLKYFLLADRAEGPDLMELWIYIEGQHYATKQESQRAGGLKYTTEFASGELKVYIRGSLRGDSRELVLEMNALQKALREQFARIRQYVV